MVAETSVRRARPKSPTCAREGGGQLAPWTYSEERRRERREERRACALGQGPCTLARPVPSTNTLAAFRSRWHMPREWTCGEGKAREGERERSEWCAGPSKPFDSLRSPWARSQTASPVRRRSPPFCCPAASRLRGRLSPSLPPSTRGRASDAAACARGWGWVHTHTLHVRGVVTRGKGVVTRERGWWLQLSCGHCLGGYTRPLA